MLHRQYILVCMLKAACHIGLKVSVPLKKPCNALAVFLSWAQEIIFPVLQTGQTASTAQKPQYYIREKVHSLQSC